MRVMSIGRRGSIRDIRALAERVHQRLLAYRRRHVGQSPAVNDTLSRILEHTPDYLPPRQRAADKKRPPMKNPGIFTVQEDVAEILGTTVGDLLAEQGYAAPRDLISASDRHKLRQVVRLLNDLFDLDDESLQPDAESGSTYQFVVPPDRFIERDHDYPRPLHAWDVPVRADLAAGLPREADFQVDTTPVLHSVTDYWDEHLQVIRVLGDSMTPELQNGWKVLVDTHATTPVEGALVAVYLMYEGGVLGRWHNAPTGPFLRKSNPHYPPVRLPSQPEEWKLWGTVTRVVDAPISSQPI
ncbi:MAG TPA: S24 family peptidase [Thermoanaerobaculia bacterium]|jgi:SOS-response transcriptional repressor LexA